MEVRSWAWLKWKPSWGFLRPQEMSVTNLLAVPRAVTQACSMPRKKTAGFWWVIKKKMAGRVMIAWIIRPTMTVIMYKPSCCAVEARLAIPMILPAIRHMIPNGEYLKQYFVVNGGFKNEFIVYDHFVSFKLVKLLWYINIF